MRDSGYQYRARLADISVELWALYHDLARIDSGPGFYRPAPGSPRKSPADARREIEPRITELQADLQQALDDYARAVGA
jgi:hypothetical protein